MASSPRNTSRPQATASWSQSPLPFTRAAKPKYLGSGSFTVTVATQNSCMYTRAPNLSLPKGCDGEGDWSNKKTDKPCRPPRRVLDLQMPWSYRLRISSRACHQDPEWARLSRIKLKLIEGPLYRTVALSRAPLHLHVHSEKCTDRQPTEPDVGLQSHLRTTLWAP